MQHNQSIEQSAKLHAAQVRARLYGKKGAVNIAVQRIGGVVLAIAPPTPVASKPYVRRFFHDIPLWKLRQTVYNSHVIDYYRWMVEAEEATIRPLPAPSDDHQDDEPRLSMDEIATIVLEEFPHISLKMIKGARGKKDICLARHIIFYRIKQLRPDVSYPKMARWCGGRDHTCSYRSVQIVEDLINSGKWSC